MPPVRLIRRSCQFSAGVSPGKAGKLSIMRIAGVSPDCVSAAAIDGQAGVMPAGIGIVRVRPTGWLDGGTKIEL